MLVRNRTLEEKYFYTGANTQITAGPSKGPSPKSVASVGPICQRSVTTAEKRFVLGGHSNRLSAVSSRFARHLQFSRLWFLSC